MPESDYFQIGMKICATTYHGQKIQGEVVAFDIASKMLALKSLPVSGKANVHDMNLLNLNLISNLVVLEEAPSEPPPPPKLNLAKIDSRVRANKEAKNQAINYIGINVSPEGQSLLHTIARTMNEVRWDGADILVMDQVRIVPPYTAEHIIPLRHDQAESTKALLKHIRKIVEKHHRDQASHAERDDRESSVSSTSS